MEDEEINNAMAKHAASLGPIAVTHAEYVEMLSKRPLSDRPLDKTSLTYWFPLIEKAGLPVPKTEILKMPLESQAVIWMAFDCRKEVGDPPCEPFYDELRAAAERMGMPCFLRTAQTSAKHQWKRTCFLNSIDDLPKHVFEIVEFSECADLMGLDWTTWVVREMLPTIPYGHCPRYADFPVCKEFRFFVDDGNIRCQHPYWPLESLRQGGWEVDAPEDVAYAELCSVGDDYGIIGTLAEMAGKAVGGSWSVDIMETERGWYVTDMAEAHKSFHWEGCKFQNLEKPTKP